MFAVEGTRLPVVSASKGFRNADFVERMTSKPFRAAEALTFTATLNWTWPLGVRVVTSDRRGPVKSCGAAGHALAVVEEIGSAKQTKPCNPKTAWAWWKITIAGGPVNVLVPLTVCIN
jgi:hypothetical protein